MSMMGVVLVGRVVQPGLVRASGNSDSKGDQSSERCLFEDMHLASQKAELLGMVTATGMPTVRMHGGARKPKVLETKGVTRLFETAEPPQSLDDGLCFSRSSLVVRLLPSSSETDVKRA